MRISRLLCSAILAISATLARAEVVQYNFDDGTLQGWSAVPVTGSSYPTYPFASTTATVSDRVLADSGNYKVMLYNGSDLRGINHATAILRSPAFTIPQNSAISARLLGGKGIQGSAPANAESLMPNSEKDSANGYAGLALRRNSDGAYLLYGSRTADGQSNSSPVSGGAGYQTVAWTPAQIAAATASDSPSETYTLDFINDIHGDWGWIALDTVSINRGGALNWTSQAGKCLQLSGASGKDLEASWSAGPLPTTALTIEAWVKVTGSGDFTLISAGSPNSPGGFALRHSSSYGPYIQLTSASSTTEVKKTNRAVGLKTNFWNHVAITWSQAEDRVRIFINGHLYHDKIVPDFALNFPTDSRLFLGSRLGVDGWMSAGLDEVRVWNVALSQAEIQQHMNVFRSGSESGLIGLYGLDGLSSGASPDLAAAQRALSPVNISTADFVASAARIPDDKPAYRNYIANLAWDTVETVSPGVIRRSHKFTDLFGKSQSLFILEIDPVAANVHFEFAALPDGAAYRKPSSMAQERGAIAAVNGSYWHTSGIIADTTPPRDKATQNGISVFTRVNGKTLTDTYEYHAMPNKYFGVPAGSVETVDVDYADDAGVVLDNQGVGFDVIQRPRPHDSTGDFISGWRGFDAWPNVMASGPLLLQGGKIVFHYRNSYEQWNSSEVPWSWQLGDYPFTAVGVRDDGKVILAVGDGRSSASLGLSCEEIANVMLALGCKDATKLDGGGSSAMYVQGRGVLNSPSDGSERSVPSAILVVPNGAPEPGEPPVELDLNGPLTSGDLYYAIASQSTGSLFIAATVTRDAATTWNALGLRTTGGEDTSNGGVDFGRNSATTGFAIFDYLDHKGAGSSTARKAPADLNYPLGVGVYKIVGEVDFTNKVLRTWIWNGSAGSISLAAPVIEEPFSSGFSLDTLYLRLGSGTAAVWSNVKVRRAPDAAGRASAFAAASSQLWPTVTIAATDAQGGEFGNDKDLAFTVSRNGDTSSSLNVTYSLGGLATPGVDYAALSGSLTIPASSASAVIPVQVLPDDEIEGDESLVVSVASSTAYNVGSPASATGVIKDRPLHQYLHEAGLGAPEADDDHNGLSNILEYYLGARTAGGAARGAVNATASGANTFTARFPHAKAAVDVTANVEWSTDLTHWHRSGESNGAQTAAIATSTVSPADEDPETIEAVLTITNGPAPARIFLRLAVKP